jgi:muramoyltetrapeptide carboxypeptidase
MTAQTRALPAPLQPGARVGVMALSGPPPAAALERGLEVLRTAGWEPVVARNALNHDGYLAGNDGARVRGLEELLAADVQALVAARGGSGIMRVLPSLPWECLTAWEGWLVGFSDVTALHAALATRGRLATLYGPTVTSLPRHPRSTERLFGWLLGRAERRLFEVKACHIVRPGSVRGVAIGGTLTMLAALVGSSYEPCYDGAVLFLEDVGEPLYRLDRLLTQLALSSRLARVNGIVAGQLSRCGRGEADWRDRFRQLLAAVAPPSAVVLEGLGFGHGAVNTPIPLGVEVEVDTVRGEIVWGGA